MKSLEKFHLALAVPVHVGDPLVVALMVADPIVHSGIDHDAVGVQQNGDCIFFLIKPVGSGDFGIDLRVAGGPFGDVGSHMEGRKDRGLGEVRGHRGDTWGKKKEEEEGRRKKEEEEGRRRRKKKEEEKRREEGRRRRKTLEEKRRRRRTKIEKNNKRTQTE
jgi:hypothetical protein